MIMVGLVCWIMVALRTSTTGKFLADEYGPPRFWGLEDLLVFFLFNLVGAILIHYGMRYALQMDFDEPLPEDNIRLRMIFQLATQFTTLSMMMFGLMFIAAKHQKSYDEIGFDNDRLGKDLLIGIVAFFMIIPFVMAVQLLLQKLVPYEHSTLDMLTGEFDWFLHATAWISAGFVAPIFEEVFYRGLLIGWLHRVLVTGKPLGDFKKKNDDGEEVKMENKPLMAEPMASWVAITISSLLFAAAHIGQGAAPVPLFILAMALGFIYRRTGSITACIVVHFLLNAYTLGQATLVALW